MNNLILIGFDRSGTSAISRTMAQHPQVELIFRPFNSGPIRKKMYQILDDASATNEDKSFFDKLQNEELDSSYFVSQWHDKYSTTKNTFIKDHLHVIITNINHFSVKWIRKTYPRIEQWAIWRDPIEILNSCIKNEFYGDWYSDALPHVIKSVGKDEELNHHFGKWTDIVQESNYTIKTAFLLAVRNYFLFKNIEKGKVIDYEVFKVDPNKGLLPILKYFKLDNSFDFNDFLSVDFNSIPSKDGYSADKKSVNILSLEDIEVANEMFHPLNLIYQSKP